MIKIYHMNVYVKYNERFECPCEYYASCSSTHTQGSDNGGRQARSHLAQVLSSQSREDWGVGAKNGSAGEQILGNNRYQGIKQETSY